MRSRRRKKKESPAKAVFLALLAIFVMVCAVSVVLGVYQKIKENYESLEQGKPAQTLQETVAIDSDDVTGWISAEEGYRYRNEDGSFAMDEWKEISGYLYRFDESGLLKTGEWKEEGQIFTASGEGYLTDMNQDPDYVPEDTGENLDNLVKANAYWCYLGESQGLFKPIMYRRATETEVTALGGSASPEMTTKNSLRAYGDYVYYLPKVDSSKTSSLTEEEKKRCDVLVRIIPGSGQKEIIADHVSGYLVLGDKIYYAQNQKIYSAESGTPVPIGENQYQVLIENGSCYLVDGMGEPVNGGASGDFQIGERVYRLESGGKILSVTQNEISAGGGVYFLEADSSGQKKLYKKAGGQKSVVLTADYGIQSFCVVGQKLYYCAYVQKDGVWYSQIFTAGLDGENVQSFGERFPGTMEAMYYYERSGEIYGEYYPEIWNRGYGRLAAITLNGSIYLIQDEEQRQGETVSDHDRLNLVMVDGAEMICLWRDVIWSRTGDVTAVLWNKPVKLNKTSRVLMETEHVPSESETEEGETEGSKTEESRQPEDIVVQPITGNGGEVPTVPVAPPTAPTAPAGQGGSPAAGGIGGGASGGTSGGTSGAGGGENGDVTIIPIS